MWYNQYDVSSYILNSEHLSSIKHLPLIFWFGLYLKKCALIFEIPNIKNWHKNIYQYLQGFVCSPHDKCKLILILSWHVPPPPAGEDWTPPTEWSPSLWPHSHIKKLSFYRNTATRYHPKCTLCHKGICTMFPNILQSSWLWFWSILALFWTLHSQLYWLSLLPIFYSLFFSSPPPSLYFLSPLPALAPPPPQSSPYLPLSSFLCPPCRSVNTSGWASMTTGH